VCYETRVKRFHGVFIVLLASACSSTADNDQSPPDAYVHSALGPGIRIRDVQNENNGYNGHTVTASGAIVLTVDRFDETHDGKSVGTIFIEDADQQGPLAGVSIYGATFIPANLYLAPGDVVSITGQYNEQHTIGSTVNFGTSYLPQFYKPQVTPSFETQVPAPVVLTLNDLQDFAHARPYLGMLIQINDIIVPYAPLNDGTGRVHAALSTALGAPALANELYDLNPTAFAANTHFTSIIGILDFFFTFYVCPRSPADLVQ
jgi:hypothetical protein